MLRVEEGRFILIVCGMQCKQEYLIENKTWKKLERYELVAKHKCQDAIL